LGSKNLQPQFWRNYKSEMARNLIEGQRLRSARGFLEPEDAAAPSASPCPHGQPTSSGAGQGPRPLAEEDLQLLSTLATCLNETDLQFMEEISDLHWRHLRELQAMYDAQIHALQLAGDARAQSLISLATRHLTHLRQVQEQCRRQQQQLCARQAHAREVQLLSLRALPGGGPAYAGHSSLLSAPNTVSYSPSAPSGSGDPWRRETGSDTWAWFGEPYYDPAAGNVLRL